LILTVDKKGTFTWRITLSRSRTLAIRWRPFQVSKGKGSPSQADKELPYGWSSKSCEVKKAGITKLGMVTQPWIDWFYDACFGLGRAERAGPFARKVE